MKNIALVLFILFYSSMVMFASAQGKRPFSLMLTASSKLGNYIYMVNKNDLDDSLAFSSIDHFVIKRATLFNILDSVTLPMTEKQLKVVGIAKKPSTTRELKNLLPPWCMKAFAISLKLKTDEDILRYVQLHSFPEQYGLLYPIIESRMAIAHVYLDKDAKEGEGYLYYVYSVNKQGNQLLWGKTISMGKTGNYFLPNFKALMAGTQINDSSIGFGWRVPIDMDLKNVPKPTKRLSFDKEGKLYNSYFSPRSIRATIRLCVDNGEWKEEEGTLFPKLNPTGDTLYFAYIKRFNPGSIVSATLTLEDEIHNQGGRSDTINAFLITKMNAPRLTFLTVKDTLNAIYLSWHPLPNSPFLSGVQIIRYGLDKDLDTLPLLPITDTSFFDYKIKAGVNYRYEVRALYLPGMAAYQTLPANTFGTLTKFSRPAPPYNLSVANEGKNIRLNWQVAEDPTIDAYFVFRGLTPNKLNLLPGRITEKTFLDTTAELSGGSQYFYAVMCQNLKQDSSIYSNVVVVIPNRKLNIPPPTEMKFYFANHVLNLMWQDSRQVNNQVEGFLLQKKLKEQDTFITISKKPLLLNSFKDSAIEAGIGYQYRVASVSFRGDTGSFSETFEYTLAKNRVDILSNFYLVNTDNGITVSLPNATYGNRKAYNIYKRKSTEKGFVKIASIPATQFLYEDTDVEEGTAYHYRVSITETDGREGATGMSVSTVRKKP